MPQPFSNPNLKIENNNPRKELEAEETSTKCEPTLKKNWLHKPPPLQDQKTKVERDTCCAVVPLTTVQSHAHFIVCNGHVNDLQTKLQKFQLELTLILDEPHHAS
jgi:hypothetical protein